MKSKAGTIRQAGQGRQTILKTRRDIVAETFSDADL